MIIDELGQAQVMAARTLVEQELNLGLCSGARLSLLDALRREATIFVYQRELTWSARRK